MRRDTEKAYKKLKANKGAPGIDGMKVEELFGYLKQHGEELRQELLEGRYTPNPVRRKEIPKLDGGKRLLGIPTAVDRVIQQSIAQELIPIYEKKFVDNSYGFRPSRDAKQAIRKSKKSAYRVMESITRFIEKKLKLKVNRKKSKVVRPWDLKYLGFSFYEEEGKYEIKVHEKSIKEFKKKLKWETKRSSGRSMTYRLLRLKQIITGWINYYGIANMERVVENLMDGLEGELGCVSGRDGRKSKQDMKT